MKKQFLVARALAVMLILLSANFASCKKPAEFTVTDLRLEPAEVLVSTPSAVSAKVSNTGGIEGTYTAVLLVNGEKSETKDILIKPGATEVVTFAVSKSTPGLYDIAIGSQKQTLTVFETKQYLLRRDNGVFSGAWYHYDPRGQWVKFSPPATPFVIQKIFVRGSRTGSPETLQKNYTIKIWDKDFSKELYSADFPYTRFSTSPTMVEHEVKPAVSVSGDFYVDFISHSESPPSGETRPRVAIFLQVDWTTASREYAGLSWLGTIDSKEMSRLIQQEPRFAAFSWLIQVQGAARATAPTVAMTPTPAQPEKPFAKPEIASNVQEIVTKAVAANAKWTTCKYDMDMAMVLETTGGTQPGKITVMADGTGILDNVKREMQMAMNMKVDALGQLNFATKTEFYVTGGWMYMSVMGLWMKSKLTEQMWQDQQSQVYQQVEWLKTAMAVDLLDTENVDGTSCYVVKITPNLDVLVKWLSKQQTEGMKDIDFTKLNLTQIFKKMSIKEWIAKDSYQCMRSEVEFVIEIPGDAGTGQKKLEKMNIDMNTKMKFYDYNKPVSITLPREAINALEMPASLSPTATPR